MGDMLRMLTMLGVTVTGSDMPPAPTSFLALTRTTYDVPFVKPVMIPDVAEPLTSGVKLLNERSFVLFKLYWYRVIADPPLFAGDHEIVAPLLSGAAETPDSLGGTVAGVTGGANADAPLPISFTAATEMVS